MLNKKIYLNIVYIIFIIVILVIIIILYKLNKNIQENFIDLKEENILLKVPNENIKSVYIRENIKPNEIPLNIFMCWKNKILSPKMNKIISKIKEENPEFNVYIFDDNDCRNMIEKYFIKEVVDAFDTLIPGAYKADLWRYCVLYLYGGIYQDIKYEPVNNFKYKELTDKEYFVRDRIEGGLGIYNGLMVCKKNNMILEKGIREIIKNCKNKYYGDSLLFPTGPMMLKKLFSENEINNLEFYYFGIQNNNTDNNIGNKNKKILKSYNGYREDQNKMLSNDKTKHYGNLWVERNIYK